MTTTTLTKDNFDTVVEQNEMVLIDFWAPWCNPCLAFADIYESCAKKYPDIVFAKVNVDEETDLAADFSVRSIPMLMVMREQVALYAEAGSMPEKALVELIEQAKQVDMAEVRQQIEQQGGDK